MPHYRFYKNQPLHLGDIVTFEDEEYRHIVKVMRLEISDYLEIVNGKGSLAQSTVIEIQKNSVRCKIREVSTEKKEPKTFIIAQALLKPCSIELICEKNTELGACEIWLFPAQNSEKDSLSSHQLERIQKHFISALKQSGRLFLPKIRLFSSLTALLEEKEVLFFFGDIKGKFQKLPNHFEKTPVFIIGPEKGFSDEEIDLLEKSEAIGVLLSKNILRAETASIAASSLLGVVAN